VSDATPEQWENAHAVAAVAPKWSDKMWREVNAILGYRIAELPAPRKPSDSGN
jgi:hypothetical protein